MNLKRLDMRGFKTFANATEFHFTSGITALVGPNGSGKSNVADALRWVLGEQSLRAVRGKRTEDVIFAGSGHRAAAGMAEVAVTFDNTSGWLPLAYSEVRACRRAYRSGENEYLVNGSRIRLRDFNDLMLRAGLADSVFAVVGQGMVDLALSLRPDERRALIDEAADIKRFHVKLHETREKMGAAEQSLVRASDLLAEISPRLAGLAEQADRLRRHQALAADLQAWQRRWFRHLRDQVVRAMAAAQLRREEAARELAMLQERLEDLGQQGQEIAREHASAEESLRAAEEKEARCQRRREELERAVAVLRERLRAQSKLLEELKKECEVHHQSFLVRQQELADTEKDFRELAASTLADEAAIEKSEAAHAAQLQRERAFQERAAACRLALGQLEERAAALREQGKALQGQCEAAVGEEKRWKEMLSSNEERAAEAANAAAAAEARIAGLAKHRREIEDTSGELEKEISGAELALQHLTVESRRASREYDERHARLEVMERWRDSFSAYSAGVRAVLQAAAPTKGTASSLKGVIGVAIDLLRVPQELETAIEVALGARAQDIVVERWQDAEAAIALLKQGGAGRATFLPLDALRPPGRSASTLATKENGVRGVAVDLVEYLPRYRVVADQLLGRTLVVEDLQVARRVLGICPPGWQIVTLDGEVVRTSGAVTGGARRGNEAGLLARQRELRALRQAVSAAEQESSAFANRVTAAREEQAARRGRLAGLGERRREKDGEVRRAEALLAEAKAECRMLAEERKRATATATRQTAEWARLVERRAEASELLAKTEMEIEAARQSVSLLEDQQRAQATEQRQIGVALAAQRTALAVKERELAGRREWLDRLRLEATQATLRYDEKRARLVEAERAELLSTKEASALKSEIGVLTAEGEQITSGMAPLLARMGALRDAATITAEDAVRCREDIVRTEAQQRELANEITRIQEQAEQVRLQAAEELGDAVADELWQDDAEVEADDALLKPQELRRKMDGLRATLRAIGPINAAAIEEYEETAARHDFLAQQVHDTEEALKALRRLSAELQKAMRLRFEEAYEAVGLEFGRYFTRLFGGGSARLVLTNPDDIEQTGIDIMAQPPGRKQQNLSLLSGGERALTAVALLFAVLSVRPIPFCVLDEVDAALDEANVGRFCEVLRELSRRTQFVVVTHNRGTMEVADSLFGITMPVNSISQVVSLRLAGQPTQEEWQDVQPVATPR